MRVAVVSDIHSNLHALEAVLGEVDADPPDELWCLGDVVGYGARPNECCALVKERAAICLAGNHDLAVRGDLDLLDFGDDAAVAIAWTRRVLDNDADALLAGLESAGTRGGVALYHGSARDPIWEYVLSDEAAEATLDAAGVPLVVVGHSHVALVAAEVDGSVVGRLAEPGVDVALDEGRLLLNPGSVGQPRDGDPRAAYLLLDLTARRASFRRVEYDVTRTQAEIVEAGLPGLLAARLAAGQ
jgi:diadenosine tetraphosphatase ApaH/serine/threonine PP2A family protein phosphatase